MPGESRRSADPTRVLLIEDNRDAAETLQMLLEVAGFEVDVAFTGDGGYEAALSSPHDVIVSDIGLPGMDGYEIARALRSRPEFAGTHMIAVTGYGQDENRRMAHEAGFDAFLVKPVDPERLLGHLALHG